MVKVLITDKVHQSLIETLVKSGFEVDYRPGIESNELLKIVGEYDVIVVRSRTKVTREIIEAAKKLKLIARAGIGLDNIDLVAAREKGIEVVNAPEGSTESVAELTIGLMIAAARRVTELNMELRQGKWVKDYGIELFGKNLFIIGFGRIGRRVAELASSLGMNVYVYDIIDVTEYAKKLGVKVVKSMEQGLNIADVVTLHVPLTKDTYHMINFDTIKMFKRGSILVNTARGAVVDCEAVLWGLNNRILYAYAADVLENEPPKTACEQKLVQHPRAIITPHIGAQTREAQRRIAMIIAEKIINFFKA
ncbi:MAG TPA: 3-phosphoglycerate dehydrogenase [Pyrodictium sp.]|nr:3-phosphoglycerate dehydrogenase [Pyrodictium sp.]HIQ55687.1 3-phosphoglycerate dehydrogenase [Pyrodictium sp.]